MRLFIAATAAVICVSCGTTQEEPGAATVSGEVLYRGCIGHAPSNPTACDTPKDGVTIEFNGAGAGDYQVTTESGGKYSINLPTGNYKVDLHVKTSVLEGPTAIVVEKGQDITANFVVAAPYQ